MSDNDTLNVRRLLPRLLGVVALLVLVALAGGFFGRLSVSHRMPPARSEGTPGLKSPDRKIAATSPGAPEENAPPLLFYPGRPPEGDWAVALEEIRMASEAGIHQYVVPLSLPWDGAAGLGPALDSLEEVVSVDPQAALLLLLNLNPPESWLKASPGEAMKTDGELRPYASLASAAWQTQARDAVTLLLKNLESNPLRSRLLGVVLAAQQNGQWYFDGGFDESLPNAAGFRAWLRGNYVTEDALRAAWGDTTASLDRAVIPAMSDSADTAHVFMDLKTLPPRRDFLRYSSERTADTIAALVNVVKEVSGRSFPVYANYGYSFELVRNHSGHFALATLLQSDIDGFMGEVSDTDRGLGGAGGLMGPVNSAIYHGKRWFLIDDTRTGIARDPLTGVIAPVKGLKPENVHNVQRRNFGAALVHGLGLIWSDPRGEGWFYDPAQWKEFGGMLKIYRDSLKAQGEDTPANPAPALDAAAPEPTEDALQAQAAVQDADAVPAAAETAEEPEAPSAEDPGDGGELVAPPPEAFVPAPPPVPYETTLLVVVDEYSRFFQQCETPLNETLLINGRDAATRAGVPVQYVLFQDIIEGFTPPAPVYLFLNLFYLDVKTRELLHARLARDQACAIWLYAPGYMASDDNGVLSASVENVQATTKMNVASFSGPAKAGSTFELNGTWVRQGESYGVPQEWAPLFYIDDKEADVLARYQATEKPSVAVKPVAEGWTSVFAAEPFLTPSLICEIIRILELHAYLLPGRANHFDTTHVNDRLIAIHAKQIGDRRVSLEGVFDIVDLFDDSMGWRQSSEFDLPMSIGETRLLKMTPAQEP